MYHGFLQDANSRLPTPIQRSIVLTCYKTIQRNNDLLANRQWDTMLLPISYVHFNVPIMLVRTTCYKGLYVCPIYVLNIILWNVSTQMFLATCIVWFNTFSVDLVFKWNFIIAPPPPPAMWLQWKVQDFLKEMSRYG